MKASRLTKNIQLILRKFTLIVNGKKLGESSSCLLGWLSGKILLSLKFLLIEM